MSGIRSLYRGATQKGYASAASAPIRVDDTANTIKMIPAGTGTTEVEFLPTVTAPVVVSATTLTLAPATHGGRTVKLTSAAGCTVALPPATGSGIKYRIVLGILQTSSSVIFAVANGNDSFRGFAYVSQDGGAGATLVFATANTATLATESDTVTWNRSTTGTGAIGDSIEVEDFAANVWSIVVKENATGVEATPFSAAV